MKAGNPGASPRLPLALVWLLALAMPLPAAAQPVSPAGYRLGIFPYLASRQIVEFFGPIAASMEQALKQPVRLESAATYPDFTRELAARSYDIAMIQPFDFAEAVEKRGYIPLAQMSVPLVNQFFVRDDSRFQKIEDLRGTIVAMPPAQGANARMAMIALHDNSLIAGRNVEVRHFNSHDSCIQQVWAGVASACATAKPPIFVFEQRMQAKLRPIFASPPIPPVLYVAHPRVPAEHRARLQTLITGWSQTEEGRTLLKRVGVPGYVTPQPAEYAVMRNYEPATTMAAAQGMTLGVFPFLSPRIVAQQFASATAALARAAGQPVHLRSALSFDAFSDALAGATYDLVVVQPFEYARAASHGYLPLAGMTERLQGAFFVRDESPYRQITDFKGQTIALPPESSAQARLGRHALLQAGLVPGRDVVLIHRKNHEACLQDVQRGAAAACVSTDRMLASLPKEPHVGLRSVGKTDLVPGVVFMAHRRVAPAVRAQLQAQIVSWKDGDDGRKILRALGFGEFAAVDVAAYARLPKFEAAR